MILHGYWRSSAAYRVRIALNLKGLAYEQATYDLRQDSQQTQAYRAINPQALVPALETNGLVLTQSSAILEWLEETHPMPPLLPADATGRAVVRAMAGVVGADIHPVNSLRILNHLRRDLAANDEQVATWIERWIADGFDALETQIARHGAGLAYGAQPTMADCFLVPQAYNAERFGVDLARWPHLAAAVTAARAIPAFAAAHPSVQPDADA